MNGTGLPETQRRLALAAGPEVASKAALRGTPENAAARSSTPSQLARGLRGDIDNILLKALQKDPVRRYASAQALADDLG